MARLNQTKEPLTTSEAKKKKTSQHPHSWINATSRGWTSPERMEAISRRPSCLWCTTATNYLPHWQFHLAQASGAWGDVVMHPCLLEKLVLVLNRLDLLLHLLLLLDGDIFMMIDPARRCDSSPCIPGALQDPLPGSWLTEYIWHLRTLTIILQACQPRESWAAPKSIHFRGSVFMWKPDLLDLVVRKAFRNCWMLASRRWDMPSRLWPKSAASFIWHATLEKLASVVSIGSWISFICC